MSEDSSRGDGDTVAVAVLPLADAVRWRRRQGMARGPILEQEVTPGIGGNCHRQTMPIHEARLVEKVVGIEAGGAIEEGTAGVIGEAKGEVIANLAPEGGQDAGFA
jgi:hypothetical protein